MRTDFENLCDGDLVRLFPNARNPLHKRPVEAFFSGGNFYARTTPPEDGPDYYFGDVAAYNDGFDLLTHNAQGERRTE